MATQNVTILDIGSYYTKIKASWNLDILVIPTIVSKDFKRKNYYFGEESLSILGKENTNIETIFPIKGGQIKDKESMIDILAYLLGKIGYDKKRKEPICVIVPPQLSQLDFILLKETLRETRWMSKDIYIFPQPLCDLASFNPNLLKNTTELVINIGHINTTITVISYGEIIRNVQLEKGIFSLYQYIQSKIIEEYQLDVSLIDIQRSLIELNSLFFKEISYLPFYGINLTSELPLRMNIDSKLFSQAIEEYFSDIKNSVFQLFKRLPKEMVDTILVRGACLTGGGSSFKGCSELLGRILGFDVQGHPLGFKSSLVGYDFININKKSLKTIDEYIIGISR